MNKFEQLIEYVINDEQAKARELFHEIVVEKSRNIYEEMMQDDEVNESEEEVNKEVDEEIDEAMGGDAADDLINDIEVEEEGFLEGEEDMEGEEDLDIDVDMDADDQDDDSDDEELEDRVVDLEDKLDELMSEFEGLMSDEPAGEDMDMDSEMDMDMDMDSEEVEDDEMETEAMKMGMKEAISLKAAPKPVSSEEGSVNKKSTVAANAGAKGAMAKPVHPTGTEAQGRPAPGTKEMAGKVGNSPAQSTQKPSPATKPDLAQATGVNTKSVID